MGFSNTSLKWIISYLTERTHYVQVDDRSSDYTGVNFGVPQGSYTSMIYLTCCLKKLPVISIQTTLLFIIIANLLIYDNVNQNCNGLLIICLLGFKSVTCEPGENKGDVVLDLAAC